MKTFEITIFQNKMMPSGQLKVTRWHSEPIKSIDDSRPILIREFEHSNPGVSINQPNGTIKNVNGETIFRKNDRRIGNDECWFTFEINDVVSYNDKCFVDVTPESLVIESFVYATRNLMKWIPTFKDRLSKSEFEILKDMIQDFNQAIDLNDRIKIK
jgi:hypothetical protein